MANDIELKKCQVEIEKLNIEVDQMRRPLSRPLNWVPMVLAVGGILSAVAQYQKSSLDYERSAFQLERQAVETQEKLEAMQKKVELAETALRNANEEKLATKKSTDILRAEQSKLQTALERLNEQISVGRREIASLETKFIGPEGDEELKQLAGKFDEILENEQTIINQTMSSQRKRLDALVVGINDVNAETREIATLALINEFQSSEKATREILSLFDQGAIEELSIDGRNNALAFLVATNPDAWTPSLLARAKDKISLVKQRKEAGFGVGTSTRKQILMLLELIDQYEA